MDRTSATAPIPFTIQETCLEQQWTPDRDENGNAATWPDHSIAPGDSRKAVEWTSGRAILSELPATGSEREFWKAYVQKIFTRLSKRDFLSHFRAARDAVNKKCTFAEGEKSEWDGELLMIGGKDDRLVSEEDRKRILEIYPPG